MAVNYNISGEELRDDKPPPFKLCFIEKSILGQSNLKIGKPLNIEPIVSEKFYDTRTKVVSAELVKKYVDIFKKAELFQKGSLPKTENEKYGWYQVNLTDADRKDRRLFAHKMTNIVVKEHLMNYAKIRE
ncbi:uncharacterized protein [Euwallacea fornicatus]|uniref:uncharacterized protein n=1 Tax=Euwallacea fornicatus TaxID=995702 RepID=UPI00338DCEA6